MSEVESTNSLAIQATALAERVSAIVITDAESYKDAAGWLKEIAAKRKHIEAFMDPLVKSAHETHKKLTAQRNELLKPLEAANKVIGARMGQWDAEQTRLRRAEEERLRKEEQERLNAETVAKAHELEAAGLPKAAEVVLDSFPIAPAVRLEREKVDGVVTRTTWDYRVVDPAKIPQRYWTLNEQMIRATVSAQKDRTDIPGVEVFPVSKTHARV